MLQVHAIESMVNSFLVGVVNVEASAFKEFCLAFPTRILKELEYEFPKLVAKKAEQLVTDIKVCVFYEHRLTSIHCFAFSIINSGQDRQNANFSIRDEFVHSAAG